MPRCIGVLRISSKGARQTRDDGSVTGWWWHHSRAYQDTTEPSFRREPPSNPARGMTPGDAAGVGENAVEPFELVGLAADQVPGVPAASGNVISNRAPCVGALLTLIVPPSASTIRWTSASPRPEPPAERAASVR